MKKIEIKDLDKTYYCFLGYESILYPYKGKLLKYFRDKEIEDHIESVFNRTHNLDWYCEMRGKTIDEKTLKNKEIKVSMLPYMKCLEKEIEIYDMCYINGVFKGYTMEHSHYKNLKSCNKIRDKIEILKMIKRKVEYINSCGIFIGDFNERNFLTNYAKSDIELCDLDNFRIFKYDFDTKNNSTRLFERKCNKKEYIDSYSFNVFTICFLSNINQGDFNIRDYDLPRILNTKENRDIRESMIYLDNSYQKKYLIDNLR